MEGFHEVLISFYTVSLQNELDLRVLTWQTFPVNVFWRGYIAFVNLFFCSPLPRPPVSLPVSTWWHLEQGNNLSLYKLEQSLEPLYNERTSIEENPYPTTVESYYPGKNGILHALPSTKITCKEREQKLHSTVRLHQNPSPPAAGRAWGEEGRDLR